MRKDNLNFKSLKTFKSNGSTSAALRINNYFTKEILYFKKILLRQWIGSEYLVYPTETCFFNLEHSFVII